MDFETISYSKKENVGYLTINRPQAMNALNNQVIEELGVWIEEAAATNVRCVIITGEGTKAFVAGADIKEMESYGPEEGLKMAKKGQRLFDRIEGAPFVTVAAVNGFALGGGLELALSCDFIIASSRARFGLPEVSLGLIPGYGGTQRLPRVVGRSFAKYMILSGEMVSADQALKAGLVAEVLDPDELSGRCEKLAHIIASRGPKAQHLAKRSIHEGLNVELARALELEAQLFSETFSTADRKEGVSAFISKRKPEFTGE